MTEHDELVARLTEEFRNVIDDALDMNAYVQIKTWATSPVAFTCPERLSRIRAVVEAVEAVRAERA